MTGAEILVTGFAGVAIVVGVVGTIIPVLPGLLLIWLTMLMYGLVVEFRWAGWLAMVLATGLAVVGTYLNLRIPQRSAAGTGLTVGGQALAFGAAIVGLFAIPPFGFAIGLVLAVFALRWRATGNGPEAWSSTRAILGALLKASAVQVACAVGMFAVWIGWVTALALT